MNYGRGVFHNVSSIGILGSVQLPLFSNAHLGRFLVNRHFFGFSGSSGWAFGFKTFNGIEMYARVSSKIWFLNILVSIGIKCGIFKFLAGRRGAVLSISYAGQI